ncbi:hypothetical protein CO038_00720 [Candidatus Pacearchaeota archaeon CG_4_9_14_0_2_um_filter_39_13]|nr:hypothetical protein [Candidatus Pacearchaeota archaeon]OIO43731.1 MAG: hypothetical protein AUJ64_01815 [Candidatus Pacearchaeota archaeon CG1_02_39_14]PJC45029.1 MAG: hypothetical protein CO038_00720 [Candidatus Pacearchaeota archaeon CG_4_9_14_0_2_um_filter_39_13]
MVKFRGKLDGVERLHFWIAVIIVLSLVFAVVISIIQRDYWVLFISIVALILTLSPTIFEWRYKIDIPEELEIATIVFIYATLFLGEAYGFYARFWWWDLVLHAGSGIALGFIGFIIMFVLYKRNKIEASPFILSVFTFSFALAIGALWEIFEFNMDFFLGFNMQKSGLIDTMIDLIVDAGGALIASIIGFLYIKGRKTHVIDRMIDRFVKKNPGLFG